MSDEGFWSEEDFRYGRLDECTKTLLQIDPATTSTKPSDFTAFSVISYQPGLKSRQGKDNDRMPMCVVRHVESIKLPPAELRTKALRLLELFPNIGAIRIETKQGKKTWST